MAFLKTLSLSSPLSPCPLFSLSSPPSTPSKLTFKLFSSPSPIDQALLETEANNTNSLPCLRSYENDIARLSLVGSVGLDNALTAAAADGGDTADEHLRSGLSTMVVETMYPGIGDQHSTVSTRLSLPSRKVKEKARKLRSSLPEELLSSTNSQNILAMTFRQVVVHQLWNFELAVFKPGSQRNMEDLGSQREVTVSFALSSSVEKAICGLAEAVCNLAIESTERDFHGSSGKASNGFFNWISKPNKFASKDSSVILYKLENLNVENAKILLHKFNSVRAKYKVTNKKQTSSGLISLMHPELEKIGGPEFSFWTSEYVPAYRLEIDAESLTDVKFEGWKQTMGNRWEVLLTHSQMVGLANILDIYFEDVHTLPNKQLSCNVVRSPKKLLKRERDSSLLGFLRTTLVAATLLVSVGVMVKISLPNLYSARRRDLGEYHVQSSSQNDCEQVLYPSIEPSKLEAFCCGIVRRIKDFYGWNGDIKYEANVGASIGELPIYLRNSYGVDSSSQESISAGSDVLAPSDEEQKSSVQEIASYQVVLSSDGRIVGFQPTSRVAVNHWSANPIAMELYGGKKLSPGLFEPGLKISKPGEVIVLELLMSLNQDICFALVRSMQ